MNETHLDHFVARFMVNLPDSMAARKEDLVTLVQLLPKSYPRRNDLIRIIEHINAHERAQMNFMKLLPATDCKNAHPINQTGGAR
jgi:hypothetical protein